MKPCIYVCVSPFGRELPVRKYDIYCSFPSPNLYEGSSTEMLVEQIRFGMCVWGGEWSRELAGGFQEEEDATHLDAEGLLLWLTRSLLL